MTATYKQSYIFLPSKIWSRKLYCSYSSHDQEVVLLLANKKSLFKVNINMIKFKNMSIQYRGVSKFWVLLRKSSWSLESIA